MADLNYQNITNNDEGKYLLDETLSKEILQLVETKSVCEPYLTPWPMNTKVENINTITQEPTATWLSTPSSVKGKSKVEFGRMKLELQELPVIIPFEEAWVKFANTQTMTLLRNLIVKVITKTIDQTYLGYVTSPFEKNFTDDVTNIIAYPTGADLLIDLSNAMGLVEAAGYEPNGWAAPLSTKSVLRNLRDDYGRPIFEPGNSKEPATLFGLPIRFSGNMIDNNGSPASKEIIVGDWNYAYKGNDQEIQFKLLDQATLTMGDGTLINLAEKDMLAIRAVIWKAFNIYKVEAFAKVTGF
jgi:HK97 family phage major capsid protein